MGRSGIASAASRLSLARNRATGTAAEESSRPRGCSPREWATHQPVGTAFPTRFPSAVGEDPTRDRRTCTALGRTRTQDDDLRR